MTSETNHHIPTFHHIFDDAHRCGSPSMRGESHCYFPLDRNPVAHPPRLQ